VKRSPPSASRTSRDLPRRSHTTHEWTGACPVVAVYTHAGTKLVSYTYDAWGNVYEEYYDNSELTTVVNNPFRYRGYYYDADLGLYYLNARYYDANTGRFISADGYVSTGQGILGYNMYAYCNNNPAMYVDYTGLSAIGIFLVGMLAGSVVGFVGSLFIPTKSELNDMAEEHYSRNEINNVDQSIDEILETYDKQSEHADRYHEYTHGNQGNDAKYNDKYLSPNGGHYEVIICSPPDKAPYVVNQYVDPVNMGTYNFASNDLWKPIYGVWHFCADMVPYYLFGNTREDGDGWLKWALN